MPVAEHASGTQTATIGTEHFLGTDPDTSDGAFQFVVNMVNLADGDELELRVYEAALSTDSTSDLVKAWYFAHVQVEDLFVSPAFLLLHRWRFSLKQTAGTGRSFKWSIRKVT